MNRVIAVTTTIAAATAATMAAVATVAPAQAASRLANVHLAARAETGARAGTEAAAATTAAQRSRMATSLPTVIGSEVGDGKYVSVVQCQGADSPPPITLARPGTPLMVSGGGQSAAVLKMIKSQDPYKTIYTCLVTVETRVPVKQKGHKNSCEIWQGGKTGRGNGSWQGGGRKGCTKPVTLNTGFGGLAPRVKGHHPAG